MSRDSYWKDTNKAIRWFRYNTYHSNVTRNLTYDIFCYYNYDIYGHAIYPKCDTDNIIKAYKVKTINPDSVLYFDPGSGFPRFKLGLSTNKRCIKTGKADFIVVSDNTGHYSSETSYVVIEDDSQYIYIVPENEFKIYFNDNLSTFTNSILRYYQFSSPKIIYRGYLYGYEKDCMYLGKYSDGTYTKQYITDNDLDKIINTMCPEPTFEELSSVVDMLNSEDAATVQLGVKMIQGYNTNEYKLSLRLILCTRCNWYLYTKSTVGTKQLMNSLQLESYQIRDDFLYGCQNVCRKKETYTAKDIAIAKKLANRFFTESFQNQYNQYMQQNYPWFPDERKIKIE